MTAGSPFAEALAPTGAAAARGAAITIGAQALRLALQVGSLAVLARLLSPDAFGVMAMLATAIVLLQLLSDFGLSYATIQRERVTQEQLSTLWWVNLAVGAVLTLAAIAAAPLVAAFYGDERLSAPMTALAFGFLLSSAGVQHRALLARTMRFGALSAVQIAALVIGILVAIAAALAGFGFWSLVAQTLAVHLFETVGVWAMSRWRPGRPAWAPGTAEALRFGGGVVGFNAVNYFSRNADNVLIGWWWGAAPLGLYAKAYQLVMLPIQQLSRPLAGVLIPMLSRVAGDPERYRRAYLGTLTKVLMVAYPLYAFCVLMADEIVRVVLGPQWGQAGPIFMVLALSGFAQPIANTTGWLYVSLGRTGEMFRVGALAALPIVASFAIGLPYGPIGVAMAYSATFLALTPAFVWAACRNSPVRARDVLAACGPGTAGAIGVALGTLAARQALAASPVPPLVALSAAAAAAAAGLVVAYAAARPARTEVLRMLEQTRALLGRGARAGATS